ncbi:ECF transporter S component [Vermiculatibacterium agrestimuris]|uniref:ECF transporter S component n=1 Tax=Vermiculatibacterium agrestimuris TaxID=2941519 RepID=UPI0020415A2E|nr:ECF transporter S component [Vermiculatibacterium agrestimuris]
MQKFSTKQLVFAALCVALGVVLPQVFHAVPNAGNVLLPMHLPVLLCGLTCGWPYGLACGVLTPLLSHLLTGMPGAAYLPAMLCELAAYGLISGLLSRLIHTGRRSLDLYVQLIGAMVIGRVVYGVMNALVFRAGAYSMELFLTAAFVTALPGILIQLILLPGLVLVLEKAGVLEPPYRRAAA